LKSATQTFRSQTTQVFITQLADKLILHFSASVTCLQKHLAEQQITEWNSFFHYSYNQELGLVNTVMNSQVSQKARY